jgi:hypothetical protein
MKFVCSIDESFLVCGVWQGHILLYFFLPLNYQLPIMAAPDDESAAKAAGADFVYKGAVPDELLAILKPLFDKKIPDSQQ